MAVVEQVSAIHIEAVKDVTGATSISSITPSFTGNNSSPLGSLIRVSIVGVGRRRWAESCVSLLSRVSTGCCVGVFFCKGHPHTDRWCCLSTRSLLQMS